MQLISHLPLLNVYTPANVQKFYQAIINLFEFKIFPTDGLIKSFENNFGISSSKAKFQLNPALADFGYDSSDSLENLQTIFLAVLSLIALPLLLLLLYVCFMFSSACRKYLLYCKEMVFWNVYIRFLHLTCFVLSIASLLRL